MSTNFAAVPSRKEYPPPREATLTLAPFDDHGTARAEFEGRMVEVEHGIPGETVQVLVFGKRRPFARIADIVHPSPDRVPAPCPYFHRGCGGCQWQMIDYDSQIAFKQRRVAAETAAAGLELDIAEVHRMLEPWRYRVTAGISLGRSAGFRRRGSQSIVHLDDCPISHPLIGRLTRRLNEALETAELPNFVGKVGVDVKVAEEDGKALIHACVVPTPGSRHSDIDAILPLAKLLAGLPWVGGVMYRHRQDPAELLYGLPFLTTSVGGRPFALSAAAFFQGNGPMLPVLVDRLERAAGDEPGCVVDVYGGVGIFGLSLAKQARRVVEIESDPIAVEAAKRSAEMQGLTNVQFLPGMAEELLGRLEGVDTVVVDPPRTGLSPKVLRAIERLRPVRILYVSCLARSLMSDIAELTQVGYETGRVELFDFYPQTYHVELLAILNLRS